MIFESTLKLGVDSMRQLIFSAMMQGIILDAVYTIDIVVIEQHYYMNNTIICMEVPVSLFVFFLFFFYIHVYTFQ